MPSNRQTHAAEKQKGNCLTSLTNILYPASGTATFTYDALSRMTNMVDGFGTTKYT